MPDREDQLPVVTPAADFQLRGISDPAGTPVSVRGGAWGDLAKVTGEDGATLQLQVNGVEIGDTLELVTAMWDTNGVVIGDMPAGLEPSPGLAGYVALRRDRSNITLRWRHAQILDMGQPHFVFPAGFRPAAPSGSIYDQAAIATVVQSSRPTPVAFTPQAQSGAAWYLAWPAAVGDDVIGSVECGRTNEAWPATLP